MNKEKMVWEKIYPYVISLVFGGLVLFDESLICSENINSVLEAVITIDSIIIGFIGTILPVVIGMRNDSLIVKRFFEYDKKKLFSKYFNQILFMGIILIAVSLSIFFRDQFKGSFYEHVCLALLTYFMSAFLLCTYRCLKIILLLVFSDDQLLKNEEKFQEKSKDELEFEKRVQEKKK